MDAISIFAQYGISVNKHTALLLVDQAREWAYECTWNNVDPDDVMDMSSVEIVNNVSVNWGNKSWTRKQRVVDFVNATTTQAEIDYDDVVNDRHPLDY